MAKASASGVEVEVRGVLGALALRGSWTWLRTRVLDAGADQGAGAEFAKGERLLRRPTDKVELGATYMLAARASLTAGLDIVGSRDDLDFNAYPTSRVVLPRYENLSAGGDVRLWAPGREWPGLTLTVRGENLLNEFYQEVFGFRAPGRSLVVGGELTLGGQR